MNSQSCRILDVVIDALMFETSKKILPHMKSYSQRVRYVKCLTSKNGIRVGMIILRLFCGCCLLQNIRDRRSVDDAISKDGKLLKNESQFFKDE